MTDTSHHPSLSSNVTSGTLPGHPNRGTNPLPSSLKNIRPFLFFIAHTMIWNYLFSCELARLPQPCQLSEHTTVSVRVTAGCQVSSQGGHSVVAQEIHKKEWMASHLFLAQTSPSQSHQTFFWNQGQTPEKAVRESHHVTIQGLGVWIWPRQHAENVLTRKTFLTLSQIIILQKQDSILLSRQLPRCRPKDPGVPFSQNYFLSNMLFIVNKMLLPFSLCEHLQRQWWPPLAL